MSAAPLTAPAAEAQATAGPAAPPAPALARRELVFGIAGYGWISVLQLVATPLLLHLLGPESLGLWGFYMAVQGASRILDLGLSPTMNREMARAMAERRTDEAHDLVRTVERGYWVVALLLGVLLVAGAPLLAAEWESPGTLSEATVRRTIMCMGLLIAVQFPIALYEGGLLGLRQMARLHAVGMVLRTAAVAAGLAAIVLGPRALWSYILAAAVATLVHVVVLARMLRRALPRPSRRPRWAPSTVYRVWRFAAGMSVMLLLSAVLIHTDKLLLSRLLPLRTFGYYTLANLVSSGLYVLILPVFYALLPALSARVAAGDTTGERDAYHLGAQCLAVLTIPAGVVIALFAPQLLHAWTGSLVTAQQAAPIAQLLVIGTALNGLVNAPYALQLAHGVTRVGIVLHVGLVALFLPSIAIATRAHGALGAASVWIALNALYVAASVWLTHRSMLRGEARSWVLADVLAPGAAGAAVAAAGWLVARELPLPPLVVVAAALVILLAAWVAAALAAGHVRHWLLPSVVALYVRRASSK